MINLTTQHKKKKKKSYGRHLILNALWDLVLVDGHFMGTISVNPQILLVIIFHFFSLSSFSACLTRVIELIEWVMLFKNVLRQCGLGLEQC